MATNSVRCKFRCDFNNMNPERGDIPATLSFSAVVDPDPKSENNKFFVATPAGSLTFDLVDPETAQEFVPGKLYYLDFSPAPDLKEPKAPKEVVDPKPTKDEVVEEPTPGPTVAEVKKEAKAEAKAEAKDATANTAS